MIKELEVQRNEIILTIGIPSYNRGHRALQLINELRTCTFDSEIEFLVSNNGSVINKEGYEEISKMSDPRITYSECEENILFYGNVVKVCREAKGKFVLLLSDEDFINLSELGNLICVLKNHPEVSCIRTADTFWYTHITETRIYMDRTEAIQNFFLRNNYLSGVVYNKSFLTEKLLDQIESEFIDNYAYQLYPHMVIDAHMLMKGAFMTYAGIVVKVGDMEESVVVDETELDLVGYNSLENRLRQHTAFTEIICRLPEVGIKHQLDMYIKLIDKTFYLLSLNKEKVDAGTYKKCLLECKEICLRDVRKISADSELLQVLEEYTSGTVSYMLEESREQNNDNLS